MAIGSNKITPDNPAAFTTQTYVLSALPISQTNLVVASFRPGFIGQIVSVNAWARTPNGAAVSQVNIGGSLNVLQAAITPATGNADPAAGNLLADVTQRRFTQNQRVTVAVNTGGTAPVDLIVEVVYRAFPLAGEA